MIPYGRHHIDEEDIARVVDVLRNGALTQGPQVALFEDAVKAYTGAHYAVAVSSCTAALHLGAISTGMGPDDTLITSPITFVASPNAASYCGSKVAFTDIDPATANMCPQSLERTLAEHPDTKMIVPVHFGGLPCDMEVITNIAARYGAVVMEDAAHAIGGMYADGSKVGDGSKGQMTCFSFHPVKAVAAGEGGMVTTNDEEFYRKLLRLRSHGINKLQDPYALPHQAETDGEPNPWYYEMQELGYHYRITDIQCALAISQLAKLDTFIARRRELAARYDAAFADFEHISPAQSAGRERSGLHIYVVRIDFRGRGTSRREVMKGLLERGVGSQVHYIPVPMHPYYAALGHDLQKMPETANYYEEALSIPLFYALSNEEQDFVIDTLRDIVG